MAYFRDWFGRDADYGYTYYDPTKRSVNWDKGYTNYSDFLFGRGASRVNIEEAASLIRTISQVMGVDRKKFGNSGGSDQIQLPASLLRDSSIDTDVFIGAAIQNMAKHVHQSLDERDRASKLDKGKVSLPKTVHKILNEERVGKLMSQDTPGYLRFVQKYKTHKYKDRPEYTNDQEHLLDLFDRIIRYPDQITSEELDKFKEPIDKIKSILSKSDGIPTDYDQCKKVSSKITKVLEQYFENMSEDDKSEGESGDDDSSEDEKVDSESSSGSEGSEGSDSGKGLSDSFMQKLMESMTEDVSKSDSSFNTFMEEMQNLDELDSKSDIHKKVDYVIVRANRDSDMKYRQVLDKIDRSKADVLGTLLRKKNRDYQFSLRSMRSGRLDTNKLAEAVQGVPTIYERIGTVKTNKLCVTVLVDESGSMSGSKANAARQAAIFLNESLKNVPDVELFIYGHTADWHGDPYYGIAEGSCKGSMSTQLLIYREPGVINTTQMGHISGKHENRDGAAIIAAAKRVRSKNNNQGIMIIISDGSPSAHRYEGDKAKKHTRRMVNETESLGFEVIQVTIGGYRSHDMFKNVINMDDVSKFPDQFVAFLKKKINTLIKEKVTL